MGGPWCAFLREMHASLLWLRGVAMARGAAGIGKSLVCKSLVCCALVAVSSGAWALDRVKSAENMARKAATAFETGDHTRAAQLYLQAYTSDPAMAEYVYGAARAEHVAGKLDQADKHYGEYLAKAPTGPKAENALKYQAEARAVRADEKASQAERAGRADNWPLAAQLFHAAAELVPTKAEYVFAEAMAREQAGQTAEAVALYDKYLATAPQQALDRGEARVRLDALKPRVPTRAAPVVQPTTPLAVAAQAHMRPAIGVVAPAQPAEQPSKVVPWSLTVGGAAVGLTGAVLATWAALDRAALERKLTVDPQVGLITAISESEAKARQDAIDKRRIAAAVLGGTGVAAGAVGGWLLWRAYHPGSTATSSLVPTGNGVLWAVRF